MPELPDVELARRYLDAACVGRVVEHTHVRETSVLDGVTRRELAAALDGRTLASSHRRGKQMGVTLERDGEAEACLGLHLGMTGSLRAYETGDEPEHTRVLLDLGGGRRLAYICVRLLGRVTLAPSFEALVEREDLGPDALNLDTPTLREALDDRKTPVKSALMDQSSIAGVGNVYADEILLDAGVRPDQRAGDLNDDALRAVAASVRKILRTAIEREVDPERMPRTWLLSSRREAEKCPRCDGALREARIGGRKTIWCPSCQK